MSRPKTFCSTKLAVAKVQGYLKDTPGTMEMYGAPWPVLVKGDRAVYCGCITALRRVKATREMSSKRVSGGMFTRAIPAREQCETAI